MRCNLTQQGGNGEHPVSSNSGRLRGITPVQSRGEAGFMPKGKTPSRRRTSKKQTTSPERRVSRLHPPPEVSLEAWQRQLRRQFGSEQPFLLENLGDHPVFSDFRVTNPARGSVYRVAIRSASPGRNFCSCPDFRTNHLGTCKHIEFTLTTLLARRGTKRLLLSHYDPPYSSVSVEYGAQRHVCFRAGATHYFDEAGRLKSAGFDHFDSFVAEVKVIDPDLRLYDDVLPFVAEVRDARRRAGLIAEAFPDGVRSRGFDRLLAGQRFMTTRRKGRSSPRERGGV